MENKLTPRYDSILCIIPIDLQEEFLSDCKFLGIDAGKTHCFSTKRFDDFLRIIYDRWEEYAPKIFKVFSMLQNKHKIKIEVRADRKIIDLEGLTVEEALKVISAANCIEIKQLTPEDEAHD